MDASDAAFRARRHGCRYWHVAVNSAWAGLLPLALAAACTSLQVTLPDGTRVDSTRLLNETAASLTAPDGTAFAYSSSPSDQLAQTNALLMQQLLRTIVPPAAAAAAATRASCYPPSPEN